MDSSERAAIIRRLLRTNLAGLVRMVQREINVLDKTPLDHIAADRLHQYLTIATANAHGLLTVQQRKD